MSKYVFVTGGVASGLGKGITSASLGRLLKARGYSVTLRKFDPYVNASSANLSPYQHGEIFVTDDGAECSLVIGHYERFLDENMTSDCSVTSGQVYRTVIENERAGRYGGGTVQVVPGITDEIKRRIKGDESSDVTIVDIGGTVGDIEGLPILEAIRQFRADMGKNNVVYVHVTLVPYIAVSREQKTKPTQHSVKELQNLGIHPDVIVCRSEREIDPASRDKISLFCNVDASCIIQSLTSSDIYEVPLKLEENNLARAVLKKLDLEDLKPDLTALSDFNGRSLALSERKGGLKIAVLGKYAEKHDAYLSIKEALSHSAVALDEKITVSWLSSERINEKNVGKLTEYDGVIIPAGFGVRGFEGKIAAAHLVRTEHIPALMMGLGAQAALVEFARNVLGKPFASSVEFDPESVEPVITSLSPKPTIKVGGMSCNIAKGSLLSKIYGSTCVRERHRHKYDFNAAYVPDFEKNGLIFSGFDESGKIPQAFELKGDSFFVGVIFRPEFISRPLKPHPLFNAFLSACKKPE